MTFLRRAEAAMGAVNLIAVTLAGVSLLLMAIIGALDVIGYGLGRPIVGAYELIETLMVVTIFMSVAAAQSQGAHIKVDLVRRMLGTNAQTVLALFGMLCSGGLFLLIAYYGWFGTMRSFGSGEVRQGQLGFPVWPARFALALGSSFMVMQCLLQAASALRSLSRGEPILSVTPSLKN